MSPDQRDLLHKAEESLAAARLLLSGGHAGFAASRAYYAMFYAAEALLEGEGMSFSKHSAVIAAFGKEFAKSGRLPVELHRHLVEAHSLRETGDYGAPGAVSPAQAQEQISRAAEFVDQTRRTLEPGAE